MSDERGTLREIAWLEVFPGLKLFSALRMAFNFRTLLLATVALVLARMGRELSSLLMAKLFQFPSLALGLLADLL